VPNDEPTSSSGFKSFVNVSDPRLERGYNHDLLGMISITLTATICGANS
jgi:hypothetical protein